MSPKRQDVNMDKGIHANPQNDTLKCQERLSNLNHSGKRSDVS